MSAVEEDVIVDLGSLSAQRLIGKMVVDEDETVLVLGDGDGEVQVSAAIGSRAAAASRLERAAALMLAWAAELRKPVVPTDPKPGQPGTEGWT